MMAHKIDVHTMRSREFSRFLSFVFTSLTLFALPVVVGVYGQQPPIDAPQSIDQQKAYEQYQFAEGMRSRQFYDLAATEYAKLVTDYSDFDYLPEAFFYWGECLRLDSQNDKAIEAFYQLRKRYPDHVLALQAAVNLATIFIETGKFDRAIQVLTESLNRKNPDLKIGEAISYFLGEAYRKKENYDIALDFFSKISSKQIDPAYQYRSYALLNMGYLHRNLANTNTAIECFDRLVKDPAVPNSVKEESLFQLGDIASSNAKYEQATAYFERILNDYPDGRFAQQAKVNNGWALLQQKRYKDLLRFLDPTLPENIPNTAEPLYIYGLGLKLTQQIEAALETYARLAEKFPYDKFKVYADYDSIECLYELKKFDRCLEKIEGFLKTFLDHELTSDVIYYKGRCFLALQQKREATKIYEKALTKFGVEWIHAEEVLLILADIYREMDHFKQAAETYLQLLNVNDSDLKAKSLMWAAECQSLAGANEVAAQNYVQVIDDYPEEPEVPLALVKLAELWTTAEEYATAIEYLDRYLLTYSGHELEAKALYLRGALNYYLGKYDQAIIGLKQSLNYKTFTEKDHAQLFLAYTLWELNKEQQSLAYLADLLKNKSVVLKDNLIPELLSEMGHKYLEMNDLAAAEKCFILLSESPDAMLNLRGLLGLGKVEQRKENFDKAVEIFYGLKSKTAQHPELRGISLAYLGESLRLSGKLDEAFVIFKEASSLVYDDSKAKALVRLGIARIHFENKEYEEALRYAISVYVLYDDPELAPEAMLIAIKILVDQKRQEEAQSTYHELKERYPEALALFNTEKENADLFDQF